MGQIRVNINNIMDAGQFIINARNEAVSASRGIRGTVGLVDESVLSRDNIGIRIDQICLSIDRITDKMEKIQATVTNGAANYQRVERRSVIEANNICDSTNLKSCNSRCLSELFKK